MPDSFSGQLETIHDRTLGSVGVCVAILDGPVDLGHPTLQGADLAQLDTLASSKSESGLALRHGTHVASLIFGQPGSPVLGVAPKCRGAVIPVFNERPDGSVVPCSQLDLARAITQAVAHGANIINISGGRLDNSGEAEPVLARAIKLCADQGILIVAATGNDGCQCLHVPAADPWVLAVGSMDATGVPLESSNWGDSYQDHGVLAPGRDIVGADVAGETIAASGTSFATPLVSGVAALMMSMQLQRGEKVDARAVRGAILDSAMGCDIQSAPDCRQLLSGRLNMAAAFSHLFQGEFSLMSETNNQFESNDGNHAESYAANGAAPNEAMTSNRMTNAVVQVQPPAEEHSHDMPSSSPAKHKHDEPAAKPKSSCGCGGGCGGKTISLVYALGQIDFDFGSEARRDSFIQQGMKHPHNPAELLERLDNSPWDATGVIWTIVQETTPVYAIQPAGPFAAEGYNRLRSFLRGQMTDGVSQVSIPGVEASSTTLMNGQTVPVIVPEVRGMYSWSTTALVEAAIGKRPAAESEQCAYEEQAEEVHNFLERVYYEISNLGVSPQERAINYAATNAFQVATVYKDAIRKNFKLDRIDVERSSVCRTGSDCWDVKLTFFDPAQRQEKAREVYRFTVDVSEVIPVTVGKVRRWSMY